MGSEAKTTLTVGRAKFAGTALLESTELLFRGETRLRIPFASIKDIAVKRESLHVTHAEGTAVLALGAAVSAKWAEKIRSPRSLADKFGVKKGMSVALLGVEDAAVIADIRGNGAEITVGRVPKGTELVFFRITEPKSLGKLASIVKSIARDGAIWVLHPRGIREVGDVVIFAAGREAGLTATKVCRVSETDTAEKLVIPVVLR